MPKFIGTIDVCGPVAVVIEADTEQKARDILYEMWLEACESNCDRALHPYSEELAEELEASPL